MAACTYASLSWPVIPLVPKNKRPITKHGLLDASTDPSQIDEWWERYRDANIGGCTGHLCDVLDVDGQVGRESLDKLESEYGPLPTTPFSLTGGGGAHFFFQPTGLGNTVRLADLPKLDWRGKGGYVVLPPSVHPNGTIYRWEVTPDDTPFAPVPRWLLDKLAPPVVERQPVRPVRRGTRYGQAALESELERLAQAVKGERNHTLNASAFSLGQLVASGLLDAAEVIDGLVVTAKSIGLSEREAVVTVKSGLNAGLRTPRGA